MLATNCVQAFSPMKKRKTVNGMEIVKKTTIKISAHSGSISRKGSRTTGSTINKPTTSKIPTATFLPPNMMATPASMINRTYDSSGRKESKVNILIVLYNLSLFLTRLNVSLAWPRKSEQGDTKKGDLFVDARNKKLNKISVQHLAE